MNTIPIRSSEPLLPMPDGAPIRMARGPSIVAGFRRLIGRSGRGYLVSVYPIAACPDYVDAIVVAAGPSGEGQSAVVWIGDTGEGGEALRRALAAAAAAGASEAHVHLLAGDREARAAIIRDLDDRH